jgi:hypothetical protein
MPKSAPARVRFDHFGDLWFPGVLEIGLFDAVEL